MSEISEARRRCQYLLKTFRAIQHIDEVLEGAVVAEEAVASLAKQQASLEEKIEGLKAAAAQLEGDLAARKAAAEKDLKAASENAGRLVEAAIAEADDVARDAAAKREEAEAAVIRAYQNVEFAEARVRALTEECERLVVEEDRLRAKIASVKEEARRAFGGE